MKSSLAILLISVFLTSNVAFGQEASLASSLNSSPDNLIIKGRFIWKDKNITGYPAHVKIQNSAHSNPPFIQSVDSLGHFEVALMPGTYTFSPQLNYHWMEEELVRIDDTRSKVSIKVKANTKQLITIQLDTIPWPQSPIGSGLLKASEAIDREAVDAFMEERMVFFEIPGATLSLIKDQKVIYSQQYGVTKINTNTPVHSKSLFEAGSITKLVFAFAVMRLYERGIIDLDKALYEYLPHKEIKDDRYQLMTARHVLSHQSGMSNWPRKDENGQFKLKFTPGTQFGYSGKAFEYLKLVIEAITSKSIDTILQEEVLAPLQIKDMHFKGNPSIAEYGIHGHKKYIPSEIFMAKRPMVAYSLQCTSEALAKFAIALDQRKGLKKETYQEFFKVHSQRADGTKWGLGVRIEDTSSGRSYGHSGSTGRGFISNLVIYDDQGIGYVVLTNSQMGGWLSLPLLNEYLVLGHPSD